MKYEVKGGSMPVVEFVLEAGESLKAEAGAMTWMSETMKMDTSTNGGIGKALGRMFTGETMFQNVYTAQAPGSLIAFGSRFMGPIMPVEITPDKPIIIQKSAFLVSTPGVQVDVFFQKKLGAGFFGGEGFIMQKVSGQGMVFLEIDGSVREYELAPGEKLLIDTGYLAMMDASVNMDVQTIKGIKNIALGGEGLFNTVVTGPGKIILQTMPLSKFAMSLYTYLPTKS